MKCLCTFMRNRVISHISAVLNGKSVDKINQEEEEMTLWKHELKMNLKTLLIWSMSVGIICFGCLLLFKGLQESMEGMADMYAQMGAFSTALGLDKVSMNTIEGFYATEVALMFALGGAMFAAMTGVSLISKEEEGHTSEFLNTLPFGRMHIVYTKYVSLIFSVFFFQIICVIWILAGFLGASDFPPMNEFILYHTAQFLMQLEIATICFLISAWNKKRQTGIALGLALLLYMMDLMCRVLPDIENLKYVTPYYFSNAADIFTNKSVDAVMLFICLGVILVCAAAAGIIYEKRDLAA